MNFIEALSFSEEKISVFPIVKSEQTQLLSLGFVKGQILAKHKTNIPAFLLVVEGSVDFMTDDAVVTLHKGDVHTVPVNVVHEVKAHEKSVCLLLKTTD